MATDKEITFNNVNGLLAWARAAALGAVVAPTPEDIIRALTGAQVRASETSKSSVGTNPTWDSRLSGND